MTKNDVSLKAVFRRARTAIESEYGIAVAICDVLDPNTGSFDGARIEIDFACDLEMSLFVLIHLFGHTVQWNLHPPYRTIDQRVKVGADSATIAEAMRYEKEASRYGIQLLHQCGVHQLDQWVSDWWASDWSYLSHYYRTGILGDWKDFRGATSTPLEPVPIPPFTPHAWFVRYAF